MLLSKVKTNAGECSGSVYIEPKKKSYLIAKRAVDIMVALVGLIVMFLPMVLIAVMIKLESPGPSIFIHNRIGKNILLVVFSDFLQRMNRLALIMSGPFFR